MKLEYLTNIIGHAAKDEEKNVEILKQELKNNDFKVCGMGVILMLDEMHDIGLADDACAYWKTLGLLHFPYEPSKAL